MLFFNTSIQLRLIPAVMADSVKEASRVCGTREGKRVQERRDGGGDGGD